MQKHLFTTLFSAVLSITAFAQNKGHFQEIKTISAKGEVIGTLEGIDNIAIIKITSADTANADFSIDNQEILCTFQFGTKPTEGNPKLEGIKKGDNIRMELSGSRKHNSEPWDYVVFRYWQIKGNPSSAKDGKSQK